MRLMMSAKHMVLTQITVMSSGVELWDRLCSQFGTRWVALRNGAGLAAEDHRHSQAPTQLPGVVNLTKVGFLNIRGPCTQHTVRIGNMRTFRGPIDGLTVNY